MSSKAITGRPTWAQIDLDALAHNFLLIKDHVGPQTKILAALKADAYGHGAVQCARRLEAEGVDWFGVALPEEGVELRAHGISKPILCLGGFWQSQGGALIHHRLTPVVYRKEMLEALNRVAADAGTEVNVHVKVDTGMGRLGITVDEIDDFCDAVTRFPHIRVEGLMTHLASADLPEQHLFNNKQVNRFDEAIMVFRQRGIVPQFVHAANSAAAFAYPAARGNMIRPGGSLYGFIRDVFPPNIATPALEPVMSLHSQIILLKKVPRGSPLGYGGTFVTTRDSLIATLPIGYDDGYRRAFSNRARVIVRGRSAPVVGRVSMDLTLVDVTDVPDVAVDDQVTLLGGAHPLTILAEDLGKLAETISYEITCGISPRVPRNFITSKS